MTTVAVLADPPREGYVLPALPASTPLTAAGATELYVAMLRDVCRAVEASGGELLVNYRAEADVPEEFPGDQDAEAEVRAAVTPALEDPGAARYEVQVGSDRSARVGNTVTHLLEREGVDSAAVLEPTAPLVARRVVDNAAMKLRRSPVVLGPAAGGRLYYAGFAEPIDFTDAFAGVPVETLTERAVEADLDVDFLEQLPVVEGEVELATLVSMVRARERAERARPAHTASFIRERGLRCERGDGGATVVRS